MKTKQYYTAIRTDKFEETVAFYENVLGFTVAHRINIPNVRVFVMQNEEGGKIDIIETPGVPGAFHALRTNVENLDDAIAECREKGCEIVAGPVEIATGRAIIIKDPNGILIDITQHIKKEQRTKEN